MPYNLKEEQVQFGDKMATKYTITVTPDHTLGLCGEPNEDGYCKCCLREMKREECSSFGMQQAGMYWLICQYCSDSPAAFRKEDK